MITILTTIVILCLAVWFSFSATKVTQRLVIPLFYMGAAGLILYSVYQLWLNISIEWTNMAFYLLKLSAISLGFLILSSNRSTRLLIFLLAGAGIAWIYPNTIQTNQFSRIDIEGEYLIELDNDQEYDQLISALDEYSITLSKAFKLNDQTHPLHKYYVLDVPDRKRKVVQRVLASTEFIDYFEENEIVQVNPIVETQSPKTNANRKYFNDPLFDNQWGLQLLDPISLNETLNRSSQSPKTKVKLAILDTGVDGIHEDLQDVYVTTNKRYDKDNIGHGTHCAGIAAATNGNSLGIASLPDNEVVEVTSIKVLSRFNGSGSQQEIIQGIIEAVDKNAQVISMSLGGRSSDKKKRAYELAVDYAADQNVVIVVAAGNNGGDARSISPANISGVITVAAVTEDRQRAPFSNSVKYIEMGVAAPGVNIMSTFPGNQYKPLSGTSMATPFVASLVSILKAYKPSLTTREIYEIIENTGIQSSDNSETGKIIDPVRSIESILD